MCISVTKEEPSNNNNINNKDILEMDSNHMAIENNLSDAAFSDDDEDEVPMSRSCFFKLQIKS